MFNTVNELIATFHPISLEEMSGIRLMNRTDTKYTIPLALLPTILQMAKPQYYVQQINGDRNPGYHTIYLDTADKAMFLAHQNGRRVREKIRIRTYLTSDITFLEVKNKNNKGRTNKKRIQVSNMRTLLEDGADQFLQQHAWYEFNELSAHLENHFKRITLVNEKKTERLTIDTGIQFYNFSTALSANLADVCVIELKRDGYTYSPMCEILRNLRIQSTGMSKYCTGAVLTNPSLKANRFKPKMRYLSKLSSYNHL